MTVDPKVHDFAELWLKTGGWNNEIDISKLSFLIQDLCEDFVADLENMADAEREDDK